MTDDTTKAPEGGLGSLRPSDCVPGQLADAAVLVGDRLCGVCMAPNPIWFSDSPLWNRVVGGPRAKGDPGGVLCPACFMARADHALGKQVWTVLPHDDRAESPTLDALRAARAYIGNPTRSGLARHRHRDGIIDKIDAAILRAASTASATRDGTQPGTEKPSGFGVDHENHEVLREKVKALIQQQAGAIYQAGWKCQIYDSSKLVDDILAALRSKGGEP